MSSAPLLLLRGRGTLSLPLPPTESLVLLLLPPPTLQPLPPTESLVRCCCCHRRPCCCCHCRLQPPPPPTPPSVLLAPLLQKKKRRRKNTTRPKPSHLPRRRPLEPSRLSARCVLLATPTPAPPRPSNSSAAPTGRHIWRSALVQYRLHHVSPAVKGTVLGRVAWLLLVT